jgi:hypothetical protein
MAAIPAVLALLLAGCVEREMTITSEPSDALVFVSGQEVGRTPVTIPFTWYGDYDIILRKEGCKTLTTHAKLDPPIYEIIPFDLLSELAPWTYRHPRPTPPKRNSSSGRRRWRSGTASR